MKLTTRRERAQRRRRLRPKGSSVPHPHEMGMSRSDSASEYAAYDTTCQTATAGIRGGPSESFFGEQPGSANPRKWPTPRWGSQFFLTRGAASTLPATGLREGL